MATEKSSKKKGAWLRRLTGDGPRDRAELVEMLRAAGRAGMLDADALSMIQGVLRVADLQVRDIMVPRSQMVVLERDSEPKSLLPSVIESGHSRFPVIGDDRDQVVGILLAKDLLRYYAEGGAGELRHPRSAAPGGVRAREQAPQRAAEGVPRQPQPHGDRRGRVRRRVGPRDHRGRDRGDRRRDRGRVRHRRGPDDPPRGRPPVRGAGAGPRPGIQRLLRHRGSATRNTTRSAAW